eukprot:417875-Pelagomonas_calceolata.AAC.1
MDEGSADWLAQHDLNFLHLPQISEFYASCTRTQVLGGYRNFSSTCHRLNLKPEAHLLPSILFNLSSLYPGNC